MEGSLPAGNGPMSPRLVVAILGCLVSGTASAQTYEINGVVLARGEVPAATPIDMNEVPYCRDAHRDTPMDTPVSVGTSGGVGEVVVYIKEGVPAGRSDDGELAATEVVLDQHGCLYRPAIVVLQAGQPLIIRNSDSTLHNVHVIGQRNRGFNIGQPFAGLESRRIFEVPEVGIEVRCDIHGWMHAAIAVFDHMYFSATDAAGAFTIDSLPSGEYVVAAWHPALGAVESTVVVEGGSTDITLVFER